MSKTPAQAPIDQDRYLVPGLVRGLDILQLFTRTRSRMTLSDFACELGVTRSAVFRVAYTLSELGFLIYDSQACTYALGPSVLRLGQGYPVPGKLVEVAIPRLEALRDSCGWSAHLGVLEGRHVRYLVRVPWRKGAASIVKAGTQLPAHTTSMGRVLLAALSEDVVLDRYRDTNLVPRGRPAPVSIATMLAQHRLDRLQPVITQVGMFEAGVASIAAPVRDATGETIAAINAAVRIGSLTRLDNLATVSHSVRRAAASLSRELGFVGDDACDSSVVAAGRPRDQEPAAMQAPASARPLRKPPGRLRAAPC